MKTPLIISGVLLLFVSSCEPLSLNYSIGSSRLSHQTPRALSHTRDSSAIGGGSVYYYTAVSFPPDYDWRRDSSYGAVQASINLYRNDSLILQIPTGTIASPDADMHHFIKGHLYTQFRFGGRTVLAKDGEPVLELDHEAILAGLLPLDGKLYSLWKNRGGEGFSLMDGSNEVFSRSRGQLAGSLSLGAYVPSGALYQDAGKTCFFYRNGNEWYVVRDSREETVRKPYLPVYDMRSLDGEVCIFYHGDSSISANFRYKESVVNFSPSGFHFLNPGYIYGNEGNPFCAGTGYKGGDPANAYTLINFVSGQSVMLPGSGICQLSSSPLTLMFYSSDGTTGYYSSSSGIKYLQGSYYHLSPNAGIRIDKKLYIVLNPMEPARKPGIWKDGVMDELDINGYISGIYQSFQ